MIYKEKEDICTHLGDDYANFSGAIVPPIYQNSLFVIPNEGNGIEEHGYVYSRCSNPTVEIAERKIAALEQGDAALCFSSGMAAGVAAIMHFIKKDSHVICINNVYGPIRKYLVEYLDRFGVTVTFVKGDDVSEVEEVIRPNTDLIYLESPSSMFFVVQDIEAIASLAKRKKIGTVIDNTYATPLHQNPLNYGIDIVMHTVSKYLGGHSDIVGGALVSSNEIIQSIKTRERELIGACMDPHQAWLLIRGIRTLPVRLKQHEYNAIEIAKFLEADDRVEKVYYPGLESHPQRELIKKQMTGTNGLLSFVPKCDELQAKKIVSRLRMFANGCSWGGFESLVVLHKDVDNIIIRIHVGLENLETLKRDLDQALSSIGEE